MSKQMRVKFVDNLKTNIEVKAEILTGEEIKEKYSRAKEKAETRKLAKDYLGVDR